jgi:hypothetical protein
MKKSFFTYLLFLLTYTIHAQEKDLMKELTSEPGKEYVSNAFKSSRVINGHSMEMIGAGVLDFRILHRFGPVNKGIYDMFGLDDASMRMGFDYGLKKNLTVGIGRSTLKKEFDGFIKYRVVQQSKGENSFPVSLVLVGGSTIIAFHGSDSVKKSFNSRVAYYYQGIIGRKFNSRLSLQVTPTLIHRNFVEAGDENETVSLGFGGRFKITRRIAFVCDYFMNMNGYPKEKFENPLSVGIDIETGGHVFQLHFSNSDGMNERAFITETTGKWSKGEIRFGFNLSRVFTIKESSVKKQPPAISPRSNIVAFSPGI